MGGLMKTASGSGLGFGTSDEARDRPMLAEHGFPAGNDLIGVQVGPARGLERDAAMAVSALVDRLAWP